VVSGKLIWITLAWRHLQKLKCHWSRPNGAVHNDPSGFARRAGFAAERAGEKYVQYLAQRSNRYSRKNINKEI
jgi:hypothetical protein